MYAARLPDTELRFDPATGLIPAVVQDARSGRILMLGYMNRESLALTRETGRISFYSRSRGKLWTKGESSGNWLELVDIQPDCDGDALLVRATAHGPTCHTGRISCFGEPEPPTLGEVVGDLSALIEERKRQRPEGSYTTRLFQEGKSTIARKVAEEAVELALELVEGDDRVPEEAADLLYHILVLLTSAGTSTQEVARVLKNRRR